ncbi:MAG: DMT family transporter [Patescibacteria group bacterium]
MPSELLIAILAGLGGMFGWGLADFFAKKTIDQVGDTVSLAWGHLFGTIVLFIMAMYQFGLRGQTVTLPDSFLAWSGVILFGILQATVYFFVYKGFGKGQVGLLSPVFASFSGFVAVVSIVILGELVTGSLLLGLAILFAGILLINVDIKALRSRRLRFAQIPGFKEVGFATVLAILWTLFWDQFVGGKDWLVYTFYMYASMTVAIFIIAIATRINLFVVTPKIWKFLFLIGLTEVGAYLAITWGYGATTRTSVVALLSGAFSLPTIILARLFLKERITAIQTIGSLVIIIGIMLLSVA